MVTLAGSWAAFSQSHCMETIISEVSLLALHLYRLCIACALAHNEHRLKASGPHTEGAVWTGISGCSSHYKQSSSHIFTRDASAGDLGTHPIPSSANFIHSNQNHICQLGHSQPLNCTTIASHSLQSSVGRHCVQRVAVSVYPCRHNTLPCPSHE